jgi:hypothetical protein
MLVQPTWNEVMLRRFNHYSTNTMHHLDVVCLGSWIQHGLQARTEIELSFGMVQWNQKFDDLSHGKYIGRAKHRHRFNSSQLESSAVSCIMWCLLPGQPRYVFVCICFMQYCAMFMEDSNCVHGIMHHNLPKRVAAIDYFPDHSRCDNHSFMQGKSSIFAG